jgi:hypothetical protein
MGFSVLLIFEKLKVRQGNADGIWVEIKIVFVASGDNRFLFEIKKGKIVSSLSLGSESTKSFIELKNSIMG